MYIILYCNWIFNRKCAQDRQVIFTIKRLLVMRKCSSTNSDNLLLSTLLLLYFTKENYISFLGNMADWWKRVASIHKSLFFPVPYPTKREILLLPSCSEVRFYIKTLKCKIPLYFSSRSANIFTMTLCNP